MQNKCNKSVWCLIVILSVVLCFKMITFLKNFQLQVRKTPNMEQDRFKLQWIQISGRNSGSQTETEINLKAVIMYYIQLVILYHQYIIHKIKKRIGRWIAEFFGTFFLVTFVKLTANHESYAAQYGIGFGLLVLVYQFGYISGAQFNPWYIFCFLFCFFLRIEDVYNFCKVSALDFYVVDHWMIFQILIL